MAGPDTDQSLNVVAWAGGANKKGRSTPNAKANAAKVWLVFLAKNSVNFVNAHFQSVYLVFNRTAPVGF